MRINDAGDQHFIRFKIDAFLGVRRILLTMQDRADTAMIHQHDGLRYDSVGQRWAINGQIMHVSSCGIIGCGGGGGRRVSLFLTWLPEFVLRFRGV